MLSIRYIKCKLPVKNGRKMKHLHDEKKCCTKARLRNEMKYAAFKLTE